MGVFRIDYEAKPNLGSVPWYLVVGWYPNPPSVEKISTPIGPRNFKIKN